MSFLLSEGNTDPLWFVFSYRNETVLHQFCCPAADTEQKPSSPDSSPRWEIVVSKTFIFSTSLSSITDLPAPDKTHILHMPILLHPPLHPMFPALLSLSLPSQRLLFVLWCNCLKTPSISTHTHTKCFFSLSSNIHFCLPTFMLVPLLTVCDTDTHMLLSSPTNYLSHTMRFLDRHTITFKVQQKPPKKLRVLSHTLRWGGGSIFTYVSLPQRAATERYY